MRKIVDYCGGIGTIYPILQKQDEAEDLSYLSSLLWGIMIMHFTGIFIKMELFNWKSRLLVLSIAQAFFLGILMITNLEV